MITDLESLYDLPIDPSLDRMKRKINSLYLDFLGSVVSLCLCLQAKVKWHEPTSPSKSFQNKCFCKVQIPAPGRKNREVGFNRGSNIRKLEMTE